jgi:uncharacterized protein
MKKNNCSLISVIAFLACAISLSACAQTQPIADFISIPPTLQTQGLVLPATHSFQVLAYEGMPIASGTLAGSPDFTAFVPIQNSSTHGFLSLNHEAVPGGMTVFDANYNQNTKRWSLTNATPIAFPTPTQRNCSGAVTPWGTVISGEEIMNTTDINGDGWYDAGWLVEIEPATRRFIRKIYAAGWCAHENAVVANDERTIYTGSDNDTTGYLYKFVSDTARIFTTGNLYVLRLTQNGNGEWVQLPNSTQYDLNHTTQNARAINATNISGIEDVEIGVNGKIYIAAKYSGQVYNFVDNGLTVSNYTTFVQQRTYDLQTTDLVQSVAWGIGNDNLAFDNEQNLWILQDGTNNYIWVAKADHTPAVPHIELFATVPYGAEPTGITFSPDKRFLFMSIQHPSTLNTAVQIDAVGDSVIFNKSVTIVIARKEHLGATIDTGGIFVGNSNDFARIINNGNSHKGRFLEIVKPTNGSSLTYMTIFNLDGTLVERQTLGILPQGRHLFALDRFKNNTILKIEDEQGARTFKLAE